MSARRFGLRSRRVRLAAAATTITTVALVAVIGASPVAAEPTPGAGAAARARGSDVRERPRAGCLPDRLGQLGELASSGSRPTSTPTSTGSSTGSTSTSPACRETRRRTNLKVPVIFEISPYYANSARLVNWAVDHEIGFPPATRPVAEPYLQRLEHEPDHLHDLRVDVGAARLRRRARRGARARGLSRRLPDLRRPERDARPEGRRRLAERPRAGLHDPRPERRGHRRLDDRQGRDDRHVLQRHAARSPSRPPASRASRRSSRSRRSPTGTTTTARTAPSARRAASRARTSTCSRDVVYSRADQPICRARDLPTHASRSRIARTGDSSPFWDDAQLHERRGQRPRRDARRAREQRLQRHDEERRAVLRGAQGATASRTSSTSTRAATAARRPT